jgi:predicted N-formylglutamate amidohydrolase
MLDPDTKPLLAPDEPDPVLVERPNTPSPFFLAVDHAGWLVPRRLGMLGLPESELKRHIGWDIGILGVSRRLAAALDATLVGQIYSRLVIDCNRDPAVETSICTVSERTEIPGNRDLTTSDRLARQEALFRPYHRCIGTLLDQRAASGTSTVLVSMHSFTPVFKDLVRPWHAGVLYNRDARLGRILLDLLRAEGDLVVGDNEPYAVSDVTDYTLPVHGERRAIPHVEIEIRQDLIAGERGQDAWARRLARILPAALSRFSQVFGHASWIRSAN